MSQRPAHLPDYDNPPVSEVFFALYFEPLRGLRQAHVGAYWDVLRRELPVVEDREPAEPVFDLLAPPAMPSLRFEIGQPPIRRSWFMSETGEDMIQVQSDRVVQNWRRQIPTSPYPHYEPLRRKFRRRAKAFLHLLDELGLPGRITSAEICYTNQIEVADLGEILMAVNATKRLKGSGGGQTRVEHYVSRAPVLDATGSPIAGLVIEATATNHGGYILSLLVRGTLQNGNLMNALKLLDEGRNTIVATFDEITRPARHKEWKKK